MIFCHFRPFLLFYPNIETENLNLGKKVKKNWKYYPFTHLYHEDHMMYGS